MADKIKKYFQKKKADAKFKLAGPGHRLTEDSQSSRSSSGSSQPHRSATRGAPSVESRQAAAAALARMGGGKKPDQAAFNTSLAAIQAQVRRELDAERKAKEAAEAAEKAGNPPPAPVELETSVHLAVAGVFFRCPMIGNEILTKDEWNKKIKEFLYEQLEEERGLTACLIIQSCNKNREKVEMCIETLSKYLENIMQNPTEEKYRKIRMSNRVYQDKVAPIEGSLDFLLGAGFQVLKLPYQEGEEDFLVFPEDNLGDMENLQMLYDAIKTAEPVSLELDRNLQVLLPSQVSQRNELPAAFFSITSEELKREQQLRTEVMEKQMMLRTKAMREKEEQREMRRYRFALIRIRFPDGVFLQGTFSVYEKLSCVKSFVAENIISEEYPFILATATGQKLIGEDYEHSLLDLRLVPASILIFTWESAPPEESRGQSMYLKPEVMMLLQSL